jgi:hypothetical protein
MEIKVKNQNGKISFYQNNNQVYPVSVSGNICEFADGQLILI